jgi:hypothetical protein
MTGGIMIINSNYYYYILRIFLLLLFAVIIIVNAQENIAAFPTSLNWCDTKSSSGTYKLKIDCGVEKYSDTSIIEKCSIGSREHNSAICLKDEELEITGEADVNGTIPKLFRTNVLIPYRFFTLSGYSTLTLSFVKLEGGDVGADFDGGAVYLFGINTVFNAITSSIYHNKADNGGGVYVLAGTLNFKNVKVKNNVALLRGGGISCERAKYCNITGENSILADNMASYAGGGFRCTKGSNCNIKDAVVIEKNSVGYNGGGIDCSDSNTKCSVTTRSIVQLNVAMTKDSVSCNNNAQCMTDGNVFSKYCVAGFYGLSQKLIIDGVGRRRQRRMLSTEVLKSPLAFDPTWATLLEKKSGSCNACPVGKWGNRITAESDSEELGCKYTKDSCLKGYFCPGNGGAMLPCFSGTFGNITGSNTRQMACPYLCPAGFYGDADGQASMKTACKQCLPGQFGSNLGQQNSCQSLCPKGRFGDTTLVGSKSIEVACPNFCEKGKYGAISGASVESSACSACPKGKWESENGMSKCRNACPLGKYGRTLGATSLIEACIDCEAGKFSIIEGAIDGCKNMCPVGRYGDETGKASLIDACPYACPAGKYGSDVGTTNINAACPNSCKQGSYGSSTAGSNENIACGQKCPKGKMGIATGQSKEEDACEICAAGMYVNVEGAIACVGCPAGTALFDDKSNTLSHDNVNDCRTCLQGKFSEPGAKACTDCIPGRFIADRGQFPEFHMTADACIKCPAGEWSSPESPGSFECIACETATWCLGEATCETGRSGLACAACAKNPRQYYSPDEGKTCVPCPENNFGPIFVAVAVVTLVCGSLYQLLKENDNHTKGYVNSDEFYSRAHTINSQIGISVSLDNDVSGLHCVIDMASEEDDLYRALDPELDCEQYTVTFEGALGLKLGRQRRVEDVKPNSQAWKSHVRKNDIVLKLEDLNVPIECTAEAMKLSIQEMRAENDGKIKITFSRVKEEVLDQKREELNLAIQHGEKHKRWFLIDIGSTNGTYLNEKIITKDKPVRLKLGDEIWVGNSIAKIISWNLFQIISGPHMDEEFVVPEPIPGKEEKTLISIGRASAPNQCRAILAACQAHEEAQLKAIEGDEDGVEGFFDKLRNRKAGTIKKEKHKTDGDIKVQKKAGGNNGALSLASRQIVRVINIISAHTITLSFTFPDLDLIHLPEGLKRFVTEMVEMLSVDLSGMTSSPECEWELTTDATYAIKMILPAIVFIGLVLWLLASWLYHTWELVSSEFDTDDLHTKRRTSHNRIIAVGFYLWAVTIYALTLRQVLSAFNCNDQNRLVMDVSIACTLKPGTKWSFIFVTACVLFVVYCILPVYWAGKHVFNIRLGKVEKPKWAERQNCPNKTFEGQPCLECKLCDERQRYNWLFEKYRYETYYWEIIVLFRKLAIGLIALFFITKQTISLPLQLIVNFVTMMLTIIKLPYLTRSEEEVAMRQIQVVKKTAWSLKRCGISNTLEVALLLAEVFMGTAGLMNHVTREALMDELNLPKSSGDMINITAGYNQNLTAGGTQNITSAQPRADITTKLFEEKYPAIAGTTATLEWIGIVLIFLGFLILIYEVIGAGFAAIRAKRAFWKKLRNERDGRQFALSETFKNNKAYVIRLNASANSPKSRTDASEGGKLIDNYEDEQDLANDILNIEKDKQKRNLERRLKARQRKKEKKDKKNPVKVEPSSINVESNGKDNKVRGTSVIKKEPEIDF